MFGRRCTVRREAGRNERVVRVDSNNNATNYGIRAGFDFFQGFFKELSKRFSPVDNLEDSLIERPSGIRPDVVI